MKKIYFLVLLLAIWRFDSIAQTPTGSLQGLVTTSDGRPAAGVTVILKHKNKGTITNDKGGFEFKRLPMGNYEVEISLVGYETLNQELSINERLTKKISLQLKLSDKQLQEVIVNAGKIEYEVSQPSPSLRLQTSLLETPQNIQVVTGKIIADQQIFDMLEGVTRNVSGATRSEHWDNYANIVMRGTSIGAFRNGMNVQMPWGPIAEDMSMVDRIEFVKGPAGFMLANGEPSGFYNVVTKKPTGITKGEATLGMGSFDTYRSTLDLDGKFDDKGKLLYRINLMGQLKGSHRDFDYSNRYSIVPVLTYRINDKTSVTAEYTYQYLRMAMIGSAYIFSPKGYGDLPRNFTTAESNLAPSYMKDQSIFLTLHHQLNTNWKLTAQLAYLNYQQTGSSMWPTDLDAAGNLTRSVSIWDAFDEAKLGQAFLTGDVATGRINHRILAGIDKGYKDYMADWGQSATLTAKDANGDPIPFNIYNPVHGNITSEDLPVFDRSKSLRARAQGNLIGESYSSVYLQDEIRLFQDIVRLTLAGRYTSIKQHAYGVYSDNNKFTPRAGISVSLDKQTSLYALYDQAFVAQQGIDSVKRKPLLPVTGNNLEAGIKRDWFGGLWNSTLSVYRIIRNNVVTYRPGRANFASQIGQTKTQGVEFDLRGQLAKGLNVIFNYAYTDATVVRDEDASKVGSTVPGSGYANHVSNGWLSYNLPGQKLKALGIALGYQWQGHRNAWDWGSSSSARLPDYFRMDGNISWQENQFSVALNINNILNKYLFMGAPYDVNFDGKSEFYYQTEAGTNFRMTFGYKF